MGSHQDDDTLAHTEHRSEADRVANDLIARGVSRDRRMNAITQAAAAGVREASRKRNLERREARRRELGEEIDRARRALQRLETRLEEGDKAPHLVASIEKSNVRIRQMEKALADLENDRVEDG